MEVTMILNHKGEALKCVAIIPDGCRSSVRVKGLPDIEGHRLGRKNIHRISRYLFEVCDAEAVAVWAASDQNLDPITGRKEVEQKNLFGLYKKELKYRIKRLGKDEVHFSVRGNWERSPYATDRITLRAMADKLQENTAKYPKQLMVLFGYDGETEWEEAARAVVAEGLPITRENLHTHSWTSSLPPVNILIRTGIRDFEPEVRPFGDLHTSDLFLPFKSKNAAFHPTSVCWPDFTIEHLKLAIRDWQTRDMRKGA